MTQERTLDYLLGLALLLVGATIGLTVADIDYRLPGLSHRSIITHSFGLSLLIFAWAYSHPQAKWRLLSIGVSLSSAIHLSFDLFPQRWWGFALINVPFYGRTSAIFSGMWLALSVVICLYLALLLIENGLDVAIMGAMLVLAFNSYALTEVTFWQPAFSLGAALLLASLLPSDGRRWVLVWWRSRRKKLTDVVRH